MAGWGGDLLAACQEEGEQTNLVLMPKLGEYD